jgi:DNA replication protein DnaC
VDLSDEVDAEVVLGGVESFAGVYGVRTSPVGLCVKCYLHQRDAKLLANASSLLHAARVPRRFAEANKNAVPTAIWTKVEQWIGSGDALYIHGPVGVGKSYVIAAAARELLMRERPVLWWSAISLLDAMKADLDHADTVLSAAQRTPVLFLDDLGAERGTEYAGERISALLSSRWDAELPTAITTNLAPKDLATINARVASRVCSGVLIGLSGRDQRIAGGRK